MNVLAGLAEGVLDAVLEREDDRERDPFAVAFERYRAAPLPDELGGRWRGRLRSESADLAAAQVLRKLDRDLLSGVVRYATSPSEEGPLPEGEAPAAPTIPLIGQARVMPSLELGADGTWHVADVADARGEAGRGGSRLGLASRYPTHRALAGAPLTRGPALPQVHRRTQGPDTGEE